MESIKLRPRAQSLSILTKEDFGSRRGVDDHNWNVPELNLIDVTPLLRPLAIFLSCVDPNLTNVPDQWNARWSFETWYTCLRSYIFIGDDVGDRRNKGEENQKLDWVLEREF